MHTHPTLVVEFVRESLSTGKTRKEILRDLDLAENDSSLFGTLVPKQILIQALIESNSAYDFGHFAHG